MKTLAIMSISLSQGLCALVDGEDYEELAKHKWYALKSRHTYYAVRKKVDKTILMHREILNPPKGKETDHINHCGLDNRKQNLREATNAQNQYNQLPGRNYSSKYKGVYWDKYTKKWRVRIYNGSGNIHLGYFNNEVNAAKAYDKAATELYGEFARLNF